MLGTEGKRDRERGSARDRGQEGHREGGEVLGTEGKRDTEREGEC